MTEETQTFEFDKFIESIERSENNRPHDSERKEEKTDARRYIERYRELPQNRTRWQR